MSLLLNLASAGLILSASQGQAAQVPPAQVPAPAPQSTQPTQDGSATDLGEIDVTSRRQTNQQRAQEFVDVVAASPAGARLARWHAPVCVSVAGMQPALAQPIIDRIAAISLEVGLTIGETGCAPNVLVIATSDGHATADALVRNWRGRFRPPVDNTNLGLAALERFRTSDAPVRWWGLAAPIDIDTGQLAARVAGDENPPTTAVRNLSRTRSQIQYEMASVTAVVDLVKAEGVTLPQLADYLAMVVLAQIDPKSDFSGQSTILNLFQDTSSASDGLTDWDHDYLKALYTARTDRATAASQEGAVANELARSRAARENEQVQPPTPSPTPASPN